MRRSCHGSRGRRAQSVRGRSPIAARAAPRRISECATGGCRSRRSRPSSWATGGSATTWPRARSRTPRSGTSAWISRGLVLQYGDHLGLPELRELIAADGAGLSPDDVLVTPGAVAALFIVHTTLLEPGDHLVVARPNYATNVETPRAIGADVEYLDLSYEDGWAVDVERIAAMLRPATKLVSLTTPHNPTGSTLTRETLDAVVALVEAHGGARLLLDETYREMTFGEALPVAASLSERVISVTSLSKTYGLPGIRVGWLVTRDREAVRAVPRGEGADPHQRVARRRDDRRRRAPPTARLAAPDPRTHRRGVPDHVRVDRRQPALRVGRTARRCRRLPAHPAGRGRGRGPRPVLRSPVRASRDDRRPGSLVRAAAPRTSGSATAGRRSTSSAAASPPSTPRWTMFAASWSRPRPARFSQVVEERLHVAARRRRRNLRTTNARLTTPCQAKVAKPPRSVPIGARPGDVESYLYWMAGTADGRRLTR